MNKKSFSSSPGSDKVSVESCLSLKQTLSPVVVSASLLYFVIADKTSPSQACLIHELSVP